MLFVLMEKIEIGHIANIHHVDNKTDSLQCTAIHWI